MNASITMTLNDKHSQYGIVEILSVGHSCVKPVMRFEFMLHKQVWTETQYPVLCFPFLFPSKLVIS